MKKTTSFHLEEDIIREIDSYKEAHNLSSRNAALERMLLERRTIFAFKLNSNDLPRIQTTTEKLVEPKIVEPIDKLKTSITQTFNNMPD